jgi:hypothetical protein
VLDEKELGTYAKGMAAALRVMGPKPRGEVLGMLRGLHLAEETAAAVIDLGLACGLLVEDALSIRAVGS